MNLSDRRDLIHLGVLIGAIHTAVPYILVKLIAWSERHQRRPGVDATDVLFVLENYLECGNRDRLFDVESDLLEIPEFDYERIGAFMAGRDLARILLASSAEPHSTIEKVRAIVQPQLAAYRPGPMLRQIPAHRLQQSARLLESFLDGLNP